MIYVRSAIFWLYLPLWTTLVSIACLPLMFFGSEKVVAFSGYLWAKGVLFGLRVICNIKMSIRGKENLPPAPYIIACKHQSVFETVMFHILLTAPVYVLKKELLRIPIFGRYLTNMGMIAIDRSAKASAMKDLIRASNHALMNGRAVIIFPEGTRIPVDEKGVYHPGVAAIYSQSQAPVVPVALNSGRHWPRTTFLKTPGTVTIQYLPPIYPGLKRDEFMKQLEEGIEVASAKLL